MFAAMLRRDRERWGFSVSQAAQRFGINPAEYDKLEAGELWPSFDTYDRICKLFGWPQAFP
jgi:transcriptional regulator with XRE-family HTH domain